MTEICTFKRPRAKETDMVTVELTKDEVHALDIILLGVMACCDNSKTNMEISKMRDKIVSANPKWEF